MYNITVDIKCIICYNYDSGGKGAANRQGGKSVPRPKKTNLTPTEYRAEFNKANYERLEVVVPKGQKATIKAHAQSNGESVNGLIQRVVLADMGLTEWPAAEGKPESGTE